MHSWSTSTISEPTLQSRSTQHQYSSHAVLHLTAAPEGSGRGGAWTQHPIQAGWSSGLLKHRGGVKLKPPTAGDTDWS